MSNWFEDDSFWGDMYGILFPDSRFESASEEVKNIKELADFSGAKVLDLCCGPGRHVYEFAKLGYEVTGVDRTKFLLDKAERYCSSVSEKVEFIEEDMRYFKREKEYDLAVNLFTSFGYFKAEEENIKVLKNMYDSLRDGGKAVFDMMGKEILAKNYQESISTELEGKVVVQNHKICDGWGRVKNDWILLEEDGRYKKYSLSHNLYSGRELENLLKKAGFKNVELYGNFTGAPYNADADRLVAVAEEYE